MSPPRATVGSVGGIVGFIVLLLCGIGLAAFALLFAVGAPHVIPAGPAFAALLLLVALLFWTAAILILRRSVATLSKLTDSETSNKRWIYLAAVVVLLLVAAAICFPYYYEPSRPAKGSVSHGDYMVEPTLRSSCSENAHRIFYGGRVITRAAALTFFSPHNPARLLYTSACSRDGSEAGSFYFGGGDRPPVQANPLTVHEGGAWMDLYWSPDDRYVVVPVQGKETLLNLENGRVSRFLAEIFEKKGAFSSGAAFRGWSPDGKRFAMVISASYQRATADYEREVELVAVDPDTLGARHVATKRGNSEWQSDDFEWKKAGSVYDLVDLRKE